MRGMLIFVGVGGALALAGVPAPEPGWNTVLGASHVVAASIGGTVDAGRPGRDRRVGVRVAVDARGGILHRRRVRSPARLSRRGRAASTCPILLRRRAVQVRSATRGSRAAHRPPWRTGRTTFLRPLEDCPPEAPAQSAQSRTRFSTASVNTTIVSRSA